jgi:hypothetical protein
MIPIRGATQPWVPLWPFLMSIHGVTFPMAYKTMHFIFYLVKVTQIIHIISVTLLHIVHLITEPLLLTSPLLDISHGHVRFIVHLLTQLSKVYLT